MAAVIGSPDPVRGEIVKAFIVLKSEESPDKTLREEIQNFVKTRLAAHEYPREIEFVKELPMTTTGKIMRRELRKIDMENKQRRG
jgi:acetyl-CoA synthetase